MINITPLLLEEIGLASAESIPITAQPKIDKKDLPPSSYIGRKKGPISTSTKQITAYTTIKGIQLDIAHQEHQWPEFAVKELIENAYDFFQDNYSIETNGKDTRKIAIRVKIIPIPEALDSSPEETPFAQHKVITHKIRITVRNSNVDNLTVFKDLEEIFDYDNWHSTKRNQFRMTTGALGDFLKRAPGIAYASWTSDFNPDDSFEDKQWEEPIVFRFNNQEHKVFVNFGKTIEPIFEKPTKYDTSGFTEVEITLPIPTYWNSRYDKLLNELERYCRVARLVKSKTDISFSVDEEEIF